jgi:hypothetical protein
MDPVLVPLQFVSDVSGSRSLSLYQSKCLSAPVSILVCSSRIFLSLLTCASYLCASSLVPRSVLIRIIVRQFVLT